MTKVNIVSHKKTIHEKKILLLAILCSIGCAGQQQLLKDLSGDAESNYILANIYKTLYNSHSLYKDSFFLSAYLMSDTKSTPEGYFDGSDEVLSSLLITLKPDGDYYTTSKLYKIEMLYNPKVLEIKETKYPEFTISIESGPKSKRTVQKYHLMAQ